MAMLNENVLLVSMGMWCLGKDAIHVKQEGNLYLPVPNQYYWVTMVNLCRGCMMCYISTSSTVSPSS